MHQCPACGSHVATSELPLLNGKLLVIFACTYCFYTRKEEFINKFDFFNKYSRVAGNVTRARHAICDDPCTKEECTRCVLQTPAVIDLSTEKGERDV